MNKRIQIHPRKRQKILERDNFKCINCGAKGDFNCLEIDHIVSVANGGSNDNHNLQTLCYKCNLAKSHRKHSSKKYFLHLSPLDRLELVKERLKSYKHLTYAEFKVVFTQDDLFRRLQLDLSYLNELFHEISNINKDKSSNSIKNINQRDIIIYLLRKISKMTYREMAIMLNSNGFDISHQQISKICSAFGDKENEKPIIERELIVSDEEEDENDEIISEKS